MDIFSGLIEFVRAAEHLSFIRAAESLGLSHSAVSKSVAKLEQRLGVKLLNRTTRSISLTEEGRFFYQHCRQILENMQGSTDAVMHLRSAPMGILRVDSVASVGRLIVTPVLPRFLEKYPMIHLDIRLNDKIIDMAEDGVDVVIRLGEPKEPNLIARKMGDTRMIMVASPDYLERFGRPTHPTELTKFNCIKFITPQGKDEEWRFMIDGVTTTISASGSVRVNNGDTLLDMALNGIGLVQISDFIAAPHLISGDVVEIMENFSIVGKPIYLGYLQNRYLSNKVRVFIDFMGEIFASPSHG